MLSRIIMAIVLSPHDIDLALQEKGLHPYVKGIDCYGIMNGGDDYEVNTGRLPEIYIRKTVSQDLFDWRDDKWILACATNLFNAQPFPVRAVIGYDTMAFVLNTETVSEDHFSARIIPWLDQIEESLDLFGQCCAMVVRDWEQDNLDKMKHELSNPNLDSPWLKGQKAS